MNTLQLKGVEQAKIAYARKHFAALAEGVQEGKEVRYDVVDTYENLMQKVMR